MEDSTGNGRVALLEEALAHAQTRAWEAEEILSGFDSRLESVITRAVSSLKRDQAKAENARSNLQQAEREARAGGSGEAPDEAKLDELRQALAQAEDDARRKARVVSELERLIEPTVHWRHRVLGGIDTGDEEEDFSPPPSPPPVEGSVVYIRHADVADAFSGGALPPSTMGVSCFELVAARIKAEQQGLYWRTKAEQVQVVLEQAESLVIEAEDRAVQSEIRVKEARRLLVKVAQRAAGLMESNAAKDREIVALKASVANIQAALAEQKMANSRASRSWASSVLLGSGKQSPVGLFPAGVALLIEEFFMPRALICSILAVWTRVVNWVVSLSVLFFPKALRPTRRRGLRRRMPMASPLFNV